jgi:hypothetical protein
VLEHQARILARIVDEIDRYRDGDMSAHRLLANVAGLIGAAEVERTVEGARVLELYYTAKNTAAARDGWWPDAYRRTDADFEVALDDLRSWAVLHAGRAIET